MENSVFTKSDNFREEYCATIIKVGTLLEIEGSDNLKQAIIDGFSVVVNKNDIKEGDTVVYCKNETQLNAKFLAINSMYEFGERQLNANRPEVEKLIEKGKTEEAKKRVGYFNKHGRVKMIRLRGCPSMGVLVRLENILKWDTSLENLNLDDYLQYNADGENIPFDFDTINGKLFIQAYVPYIGKCGGYDHRKKLDKKMTRFDRIVPGQFSFHYDTAQLESNMWRLHPEDIVNVSVKIHGTSAIFSNTLVKKPVKLNAGQRWYNRLVNTRIKGLTKQKNGRKKRYDSHAAETEVTLQKKLLKDYVVGYGNVYSSRTVIKNQYINANVTDGFYSDDIWAKYNKLLKPLLSNGMTVYGEIFGYIDGTQQMIQKQYDYGCAPGKNSFMPYRITTVESDGKKREWEPAEVLDWTNIMLDKHPELKSLLTPITILYHGKLKDLFPEIPIDEQWKNNLLAAMKIERKRFGMEQNEPLCLNKVPREGICIRIDGDPIAECFKLKTNTFRLREQKAIDKGEVDMEMAEAY